MTPCGIPGLAEASPEVLCRHQAPSGDVQAGEQVALAYLTRRPSLRAIPKATTLAHVEDDAAAADLELDAEAIEAIEAAFPRGPWRGLATL